MKKKQEKTEHWYNKFWFTRNLCWLYVALVSCYIDIKNFFLFREEMKRLSEDSRSEFNQLGLNVNWLGNIVYTHKMIGKDRAVAFDDRLISGYLKEQTQIEHSYLFDKLNWGEFLITYFVEFSDEDNNKYEHYGVMFKFVPISLGNPRILKFLIFYLIVFGLPIWIFRHQIWFGLTYLGKLLVSGF